jgi:cell division septal protein FtsQ
MNGGDDEWVTTEIDVLDLPGPGRRLAVDPRFRRRWAEARRAEGRRRLRALMAVLGVVVVVAGGVGLLHSPLFRVEHVTVVGNRQTPSAEIIAAAGLDRGRSLMVDAGGRVAEQAVQALPWVGTVSFTRHWPWTVVVTVTERVPAAIVNTNGGSDVVDPSGRVLEVLPARERAPALPVVEGARGALAGQRISPSSGTSGAKLSEVLSAAAATPPMLAARGLQLGYSPASGLRAYVGPAKTVVLLGDPAQVGVKLAVLEELAAQVTLSGYAQIDLTVPQRPALTPLPNSGST